MSNNTNNTSSIVSKIWAFCNTLRDDGVGYGDCLNQDFQDDKIYRI
jgi:type I restriction enzyme M protein